MSKKRKKRTVRASLPPPETAPNRIGVVVTLLLILGLAAAVVYVSHTTP